MVCARRFAHWCCCATRKNEGCSISDLNGSFLLPSPCWFQWLSWLWIVIFITDVDSIVKRAPEPVSWATAMSSLVSTAPLHLQLLVLLSTWSLRGINIRVSLHRFLLSPYFSSPPDELSKFRCWTLWDFRGKCTVSMLESHSITISDNLPSPVSRCEAVADMLLSCEWSVNSASSTSSLISRKFQISSRLGSWYSYLWVLSVYLSDPQSRPGLLTKLYTADWITSFSSYIPNGAG